jgi:hypothetical protein
VINPNVDTPKPAATTVPPTTAPNIATPAVAATTAPAAVTATTAATATLKPTDAPTPTASPAPVAIKVGDLIFEDKFESQGPWSVGDAADSSVTVTGGTLTYIQKNPGSFSVRIISRLADDFYAEVGVTPPNNCGTLDKYGFVFRAQDVASYYVFQIDCDGRYRLLRFGVTAANPIIDWTVSTAIVRGNRAFNTLGVQAKGTATDSAYLSGRFGLWVGANVTRDLTMKFTGLKAYKLP